MDYAGLKIEIAKPIYAGLSDAQIAAALVAPVSVPGPSLIAPDLFLARFTAAEFVAVRSSVDANAQFLLFRLQVQRDPMDLAGQTVQQGIGLLVSLGYLTTDRAAAIASVPTVTTTIAAQLGFDPAVHDMTQEIAAARIWSGA